MNEIYWLTRLYTIYDVCCGILIICAICLSVSVILCPVLIDLYKDLEESGKSICSKVFRGFCIGLLFSALGVLFIPSKKELLLIYGLGGTFDYVKSNEKAKELPDKVVDALTRYVDTIAKEEQEQ